MSTHASWGKAPGMLEVHGTDISALNKAIERAVRVVKEAALEHQTGILITQINTEKYVVRAHPAVPFGLVRQSVNESPRVNV